MTTAETEVFTLKYKMKVVGGTRAGINIMQGCFFQREGMNKFLAGGGDSFPIPK